MHVSGVHGGFGGDGAPVINRPKYGEAVKSEKFKQIRWLALIAALSAVLLIFDKNSTKSVENTPVEQRLQALLSDVAGAGEVRVLVNESESGGVTGVCILTDAADDVATVFRLQRAAGTALGIDNDRIEVIRREDGR